MPSFIPHLPTNLLQPAPELRQEIVIAQYKLIQTYLNYGQSDILDAPVLKIKQYGLDGTIILEQNDNYFMAEMGDVIATLASIKFYDTSAEFVDLFWKRIPMYLEAEYI